MPIVVILGMAQKAYTPPDPEASMDAVRENYITWALHDRYIEEGYAPNWTWNPYILNGNPLLANQFAIPYSPFKLLNFLFSAPVAWSWAMVLKSFINGLFTYLLLRALGRGTVASTLGALAWMLSSPLAHQTQTTYNEGVALLPMVFFLTLRSLQRVDWRGQAMYGLLAAIVAGFQFLAGNVQMTIYAFLIVFIFALYWAWDVERQAASRWVRWRPLWTVLLVYGGGVLVGSVQIWTSYELLGLSIRGTSQTHQNKGIQPYTFLSFLNPWVYHLRNFEFPALREKYWLNYRWTPYIGLLPLLGFGVALRFVRSKLAWVFIGFVLLVYGVLQLVYPRPIFNIVSQLPAYDALEQIRILIVLPFPMAIGAAFGFDWLLDNGVREWKKLRPILWLAALVIPLMLLLVGAGMVFFDGELQAAQNLNDSFEAQRTQVGTAILSDYYHIKNPLFAASLISAIVGLGLVAAYGRGKLGRNYFGWLILGIVAAEMLLFAKVNVAATDEVLVYPVTPAIEFLQTQAESEVFRIGTAFNNLYEGREGGDYASYRNDHGWYLSSNSPVLIPNTATLYGLQDIRGYESVYTLGYSEYLAVADGRSIDNVFGALAMPSQAITNSMLDALNVKYILAIEPLDDPALALVYEDEILIYENLNALPRVMLYSDYEIFEDP